MQRLMYILLVISVVCFISCDDDSTVNSVEREEFLLRVLVTDNAGNPVPDTRVSAWNHLPGIWPPPKCGEESVNPMAATTIRFDAPVAGSARIDVRDLNGHSVDSLHFDTVFAGSHAVVWVPPDSTIGGVFIVHLSVHGLNSDSLLFHDSIFASVCHFDAAIAVIGYTSDSGIMETPDSLLFPNLFDLPPITRTNEMGETLGQFSYSDTIRIEVLDTVHAISYGVNRKITPGINSFSLSLPRASAAARSIQEPERIENPDNTSGLRGLSDTNPPPPTEFILYQNYPNPFN